VLKVHLFNALLDTEAYGHCRAGLYEMTLDLVDTRSGYYKRNFHVKPEEVEFKVPTF
jgi:hypothetical protein